MRNRLLILCFLFGAFAVSCCKDNTEPRKGKTSAIFNPDKEYGTVTDIDGNVYKTITIGTQTWMAENLRVTHYQNGDPIPNVTDNDQWFNLRPAAYCSFNNTKDVDSIATYGRLYNWYAVSDNRSIAPEGWHVPTADEWATLIAFVDAGDGIIDQYGASTIAGGRLKEAGSLHWGRANKGDNSSGFTALPGGDRFNKFQFNRWLGNYWTATDFHVLAAFSCTMCEDFLSINPRGSMAKLDGQTVRCLKD